MYEANKEMEVRLYLLYPLFNKSMKYEVGSRKLSRKFIVACVHATRRRRDGED